MMGRDCARGFIFASLVFLLLACLEGLVFPTKKMFGPFYSSILHVSPDQVRPYLGDFFSRIHTHISLLGWLTSAAMGVLYFVVPMIRGEERYSRWICRTNLWIHVVGVAVLCIAWHVVGVVGLGAGYSHGTAEFSRVVKPYKPLVFAGAGLVFLSAVLFSYNMVRCLGFAPWKGTKSGLRAVSRVPGSRE
jgi:cbb3-type cytochrome oxidase subunit 1